MWVVVWRSQGGKLIAGWSDEPFRGRLHIKLRGDHRTPDWPLPEGPNQGSKVLGRSPPPRSNNQTIKRVKPKHRGKQKHSKNQATDRKQKNRQQ